MSIFEKELCLTEKKPSVKILQLPPSRRHSDFNDGGVTGHDLPFDVDEEELSYSMFPHVMKKINPFQEQIEQIVDMFDEKDEEIFYEYDRDLVEIQDMLETFIYNYEDIASKSEVYKKLVETSEFLKINLIK